MTHPTVANCCHYFVVPTNYNYQLTGTTYRELWDATGCNLAEIVTSYQNFRICEEATSFSRAIDNMQMRRPGMPRAEAVYRLFADSNTLDIARALQDEAIRTAVEIQLTSGGKILVLLGVELFPNETMDMIMLAGQLTLAGLEYDYSPPFDQRRITSRQLLFDYENTILGIEFNFESPLEFHRRLNSKRDQPALPPPPKTQGA